MSGETSITLHSNPTGYPNAPVIPVIYPNNIDICTAAATTTPYYYYYYYKLILLDYP